MSTCWLPAAKKKPPAKQDYKKQKEQNQYFTTNALLISSLMPFIPNDERNKVQKWLKILYRMGENEIDRTTRNDYMWFLLVQLESGIVTVPFIKEPPNGILLPIQDSVEKRVYEEILEAANNRSICHNMDLENLACNDKLKKCKVCRPSEFHSNQPIPNYGVIAYGSCFSDQYS